MAVSNEESAQVAMGRSQPGEQEFVRAQIFGTTFEITSRYGYVRMVFNVKIRAWDADIGTLGTRICSQSAWALLASYG